VGNGTHAANPLGDLHGVKRVSADQYLLKAAEHVAAHSGGRHGARVHLKLDRQVSFDSGNRVYDNL
jgi:hypothetical protein